MACRCRNMGKQLALVSAQWAVASMQESSSKVNTRHYVENVVQLGVVLHQAVHSAWHMKDARNAGAIHLWD